MECIGDLLLVVLDCCFPYAWLIKDPSDSGVFVTLPGHQAEVNCVKFMQNGSFIVSGDQKGIIQIRTKRAGKVTERHK